MKPRHQNSKANQIPIFKKILEHNSNENSSQVITRTK